MRKPVLRLAALALVAFSLVATACFQLRVVSLVGEKALAPGAQTSYKLDLFRMSDAQDSLGYIFLLVGLEDLDFPNPVFSNWDLKGNFGGPFGSSANCLTADKYCQHDAIENMALSGTECQANGITASEIDAAAFDEWRAFRTTNEINSSLFGFSQKFRMKLHVKREAGTDDTGAGRIVIISGSWNDTIDPAGNQVDSGELTCTAVYMGTIPFKP